MRKIEKTISYSLHGSQDSLSKNQQELLETAKNGLSGSYSPYSKFKVSATLLLSNGKTITGTNQENNAYPSGMCAERVAIYSAMSQNPGQEITKIAITAQSENYTVDHPITPCGACRQAMLEYRLNQDKPIEIIMQGETGDIVIIDDLIDLMPLHFCETKLKE